MPVSFVRLPRTLIAVVSGPVSQDQLDAYLPVLAAGKDDTVVVDLAAAEGLDTAFLGVLSTLADRLTALGRALYIAAPGKMTQTLLDEAALHKRAIVLTEAACRAS